MTHRTVLGVEAILIGVTLRLAAGGQSVPSPSSLAGTVVNDTGLVACAHVTLHGAGQTLSTRTGPDGHFAFGRIPFRVEWVFVDGGASGSGRSLTDPAHVTLRSSARAMLAGILFDEHHQPARNVEVTALVRREQYGRPRFVPAANDVTEADGSYCIGVPDSTDTRSLLPDPAALIPDSHGDTAFLVGVVPTGTWLAPPIWAVDRVKLTGRPPTYFPSVTTSAEARVLSLRRGETREGLNFTLQAGRVTRVEGEVLDPGQSVLSASDVVLEPPDENVAIHRRVTPDAAGHFAFDDVPDGTYTVRLFPSGWPAGVGRWGRTKATVRGQGSVHVTIATHPTQTFSGVATFLDQPSMLPGVPLVFPLVFSVGAVRLADPSDRFPQSFYPTPRGTVDESGGFTLRNLMPGRYQLSVSGADWRGWHLDAITAPVVGDDGTVATRDVTKTPLIVEAGRDTFGARVLLSPETPRITGTILDDAGAPVPGDVIVYPLDERKWPADRAMLAAPSGISRRLSRSDGTFDIVALDPGDYLAVAVQGAPGIDAGLLAALRPVATRVTIGSSAVRLTLTRVTWPPRQPTIPVRFGSKTVSSHPY